MSLATSLQQLGSLISRAHSDAAESAPNLIAALRAAQESAALDRQEDLARLCRGAVNRVSELAERAELRGADAEVLLRQLDELLQFAQASLAAQQSGAVAPVVGELLGLLDGDAERQFRDAVAMLVGNSLSLVQELEEETLALEAGAGAETLGGIRRAMHTLKAEFGALNLLVPQQLCHLTESLVDASAALPHNLPVDALLEVGDRLKHYLEQLAQDAHAKFANCEALLARLGDLIAHANAPQSVDGPVVLAVEGDFVDSLPEFITEARSHLAEAESALLAIADGSGASESIHVTFRAFHTIKGVAGFLNLAPIVELAHAAETVLDGARSQRLHLHAGTVDLLLAAGDLLQQLLATLEGQSAPSQRQHALLLQNLQRAARGEAKAPAQAPVAEAASVVVPSQPPKVQPTLSKVERTVKVSTTRLDMLVDLVGELVIAQSMVLQEPAIQRLNNQALCRNISQVGKITRDLQEAAMSLRMVTVKSTFQKMARLVRDVACKSGKKVNLTILGEDTELDRNVVEQISDPLVHMLRNAIDHGLEHPAERTAAGKPVEGALSLAAYHQGGSIVIEIKDDGKGINRQKVISKALSKGLLPPDSSEATLSEQEVYALLFLPGFSTAEQVTDLSGRGVGMDVVRRNIDALRGKVEIDSTTGQGTTFRMRLPLTLAIIDGMVVRVGSERYVVPTLSIERSFRPEGKAVHYLVDRGECIEVRGSVLPIYRLKQLFRQSDGIDAIDQGILIVIEVDGERTGLFVDEILGQQQVVIKALGMQGQRLAGVSGGAIMSDGRIALILDLQSLVGAAAVG